MSEELSTGGFHAPDLTRTRQLVLVVVPDWNVNTAQLRCFERDDADAPWRAMFAPTAVVIGRNGLAWGLGLHGQPPAGPAPVKHEGDGRAPAGAFALPKVFGYAPAADADLEGMPYLPLTASVVGVDDPRSRYYNRVFDSANVADKDWRSAEVMLRADGLYRWGIIVGHNPQPVPGSGSCIFLHVWPGADVPTAGCTAMPAGFVENLARWLDRGEHPALVQLTADEYERRKPAWRLP